MTVRYVNGTPCYNCSDVERAKKAAFEQQTTASDPLHPSTVIPVTTAQPGEPGAQSGQPGQPTQPADGTNQPLAAGPRGITLNLLL